MDRSRSPTRCVEMATRSLQLPSSCPSPDAFKATSRTRKCRLFAAFDHFPGALVGSWGVSPGVSARFPCFAACTSVSIGPSPVGVKDGCKEKTVLGDRPPPDRQAQPL